MPREAGARISMFQILSCSILIYFPFPAEEEEKEHFQGGVNETKKTAALPCSRPLMPRRSDHEGHRLGVVPGPGSAPLCCVVAETWRIGGGQIISTSLHLWGSCSRALLGLASAEDSQSHHMESDAGLGTLPLICWSQE